MNIKLGERLGAGGYGDIFAAEDDLGRQLAVKFIRSSAGDAATARDHAAVLARIRHPAIVPLIAFQDVEHPETRLMQPAIVMERLTGPTLGERLRKEKFSAPEATEHCETLIAAVRAIHEAGIYHGDLHQENVILTPNGLRVIDPLYHDTLAGASPGTRDRVLQKDVAYLRILMSDIMLHSDLSPTTYYSFSQQANGVSGLGQLIEAFERAVTVSTEVSKEQAIQQAITRVTDENFVDSKEYAVALASETPVEVSFDLLKAVVNGGLAGKKQRIFLFLVWKRLSAGQKASIAQMLAQRIDIEVPKGNWAPQLHCLASISKDGWGLMPLTTRLRLERLVVDSILAGSHDFYGVNLGAPGALGTFANSLWRNFASLDALVEALATKLRFGWNSQNYVGKNFIRLLPRLADTGEREAQILGGLGAAISNDAKLVVRRFDELPKEWKEKLEKFRSP